MYRDNMFLRTGTYTASIKAFTRGTWDWLEIGLCKGDADYITRHCRDRRECVPTLRKRGKCWYLDFAFEEKTDLPDTEACGRKILAVDPGINFSRRFKRDTGYSPVEYVNCKKLDYAKNLLIRTDLSVTELAEKTGFSIKGFIKLFSKAEGCRPLYGARKGSRLLSGDRLESDSPQKQRV